MGILAHRTNFLPLPPLHYDSTAQCTRHTAATPDASHIEIRDAARKVMRLLNDRSEWLNDRIRDYPALEVHVDSATPAAAPAVTARRPRRAAAIVASARIQEDVAIDTASLSTESLYERAASEERFSRASSTITHVLNAANFNHALVAAAHNDKTWSDTRVEVRTTPSHGYGLYAAQALADKSITASFGVATNVTDCMVTASVSHGSVDGDVSKEINVDEYVVDIAGQKERVFYPITQGGELHLGALANHAASTEEECNAHFHQLRCLTNGDLRCPTNGDLYLVLVTSRDIAEGEEIRVDYGKAYAEVLANASTRAAAAAPPAAALPAAMPLAAAPPMVLPWVTPPRSAAPSAPRRQTLPRNVNAYKCHGKQCGAWGADPDMLYWPPGLQRGGAARPLFCSPCLNGGNSGAVRKGWTHVSRMEWNRWRMRTALEVEGCTRQREVEGCTHTPPRKRSRSNDPGCTATQARGDAAKRAKTSPPGRVAVTAVRAPADGGGSRDSAAGIRANAVDAEAAFAWRTAVDAVNAAYQCIDLLPDELNKGVTHGAFRTALSGGLLSGEEIQKRCRGLYKNLLGEDRKYAKRTVFADVFRHLKNTGLCARITGTDGIDRFRLTT